ncbi:hypothetical protein NQ176_g4376 [Zarea fungicola]|uniref:Uncharacterized protein n=1 Tax=Zarea fungicola TaxID=93591 RepID=A0ACC1NFX9_9HYPO|nr:hypothetical protein NQ176_g4376 [Lecanicillium fungicola]
MKKPTSRLGHENFIHNALSRRKDELPQLGSLDERTTTFGILFVLDKDGQGPGVAASWHMGRLLHRRGTPLLLRQGAIVPLDADVDGRNGAENPRGFEIVVIVGADGQFSIMEEDESAEGGVDKATWVHTSIQYLQRQGTLTIGPNRGGALAYSRTWSVRFLGLRNSDRVMASVGGASASMAAAQSVENGIVVELGHIAPGDTAIVYLGPNPQLSINDPESLIFPLLYDAQIEFSLKDKIDAIISPKDVPVSIRVTQIAALDMDEDLRHILNEFFLADSRS